MDILYLVLAMVVVGALMAALAGPIWKGSRPYGAGADYIAAIVAAVVVGLLDYYVIPRMGFSDTLKWAGVAIEPALSSLIVLWVMRRVKK